MSTHLSKQTRIIHLFDKKKSNKKIKKLINKNEGKRQSYKKKNNNNKIKLKTINHQKLTKFPPQKKNKGNK